MSEKKLVLVNPENNNTYEIVLNQNDYHRATTDMSFATSLLEHCENTEMQSGDLCETHEEKHMQKVWSTKGKPSLADNKATKLLLQFRGNEEFEKKFDDKTTIKLSLWKEIANVLKKHYYEVDAVQCRQKFYNLQKLYVNFKQHMRRTGEEHREPPEFYKELHKILGSKDKITLKYISDTLEPTESKNCDVKITEIDEEDSSISEAANEIENNKPSTSGIISKSMKTVKPDKLTKTVISEEIKKDTQDLRNRQDNNFKELIEVLKEDQRQRVEFMNVIKSAMKSSDSE